MTKSVEEKNSGLYVTKAESGMKLIRFLERRLIDAPPAGILQKWIRTGQVRINGKRSKPFSFLEADDLVRVPPFALPRTANKKQHEMQAIPGLECIHSTTDLLVINKPSGLAVQPGNGQDSIVDRLTAAFVGHPFIPAPAHRLDKYTSGLVLAGLSHTMQKQLHEWFTKEESIGKEYLAWSLYKTADTMPEAPQGLEEKTQIHQPTSSCLQQHRGSALDALIANCPFIEPPVFAQALPHTPVDPTHPGPSIMLHDLLGKAADADGKESMCVMVDGLEARSLVRPIARYKIPEAEHHSSATMKTRKKSKTQKADVAVLFHVVLLTGRTHQIRVQLAHRGFPVHGDVKYGGQQHFPMLLHAWRVSLPGGQCFSSLPVWPAPYTILA